MNIDQIKKIELEISSDCNAACPGCARTLHKNLLQVNSITLKDIQRLFPDEKSIAGKEFKFCGVLGDPAMNSECVDMVDYLVHRGAYCELSTNGGVQKPEWWARLGKLAKKFKDKVHIHFCIDGHEKTNHIYRVNTKFSTIKRNMEAYAWEAPPDHATWIYIVFDHNEHELQIAEHHAKILQFGFATRTGMRNSYHKWVAQLSQKQDKKIIKKSQIITTTGSKEHSKKEVVKKIDNFLKNNNTDNNEIKQSIVCKLIHQQEIFIANDLTMWPCCFLWDSAFKNQENIQQKLEVYKSGWNSLKYNSIDEVLQHPWFTKTLQDSWSLKHPQNLKKCIRTCAHNQAYHNEINYKIGNTNDSTI